jgi:hypothetical protein
VRSQGLFREAWRLYRSHWLAIVRVGALVYAAAAALLLLLAGLGVGIYAVALGPLLWIATIFWLAAPTAAVVERIRWGEERPEVRKTFERVSTRLNRISVAGLLAGIGIYFGLALLVIPGLFLLTRWSMLVPVIVLEGAPVFRAFARSRDLVRGHGLRVFGAIFRAALFLLATWMVVGFVFGIVDASGVDGALSLVIAFSIVAVTVFSVATPLATIAWTLLYFELRAERPPREEPFPRRLRASTALDEAWATYKTHPGRLIALGGIVAVPVALAQAAVAWADADYLGSVPFAATLVGFLWLAGLLAAGLEDFRRASGTPWLRDLLGRTGPRIATLVAAGLVAGAVFATVIGLVLLPYWSVVGAVILVEGLGLGPAFGKSRNLASGNFRRVVTLVFVSVVLALLVSGLILAFLPPLPDLWLVVVTGVANALTAPYVGLAWANMYGQLRALREQAELPAPELAPPPDVRAR